MIKKLLKMFILFCICGVMINGRGKENMELTNEEMKEISNYGKVKILDEIDGERLTKFKKQIFYYEVKNFESEEFYSKLKSNLGNEKYQIFFTGISMDEDSNQKICVIKSKDKYESLRIFKTNGSNYGFDTEEVIEKLKKWDSLYGIEIKGVDKDWVYITLNKLPSNLNDFSKEIYEFCPDTVEQGVGSISSLKILIQERKEIFLWWD